MNWPLIKVKLFHMNKIPEDKYYLKVGKASDLKNPFERRLFRFFEIFPGLLAWLTLLSVVFLSWLKPIWIAFFIIVFDVYWLIKTVYLSLHLRLSWNRMRKSLKVDWLKKVKERYPQRWPELHHLVIFPMYKESLDVVRPAFESIINSDYPKEKMIVVLATEERVGRPAQEVAQKIKEEFGHKFFKFLITQHPGDIVGEMPGKGSNETWAARQVKKEIIDPLKIPYKDIVVSVFDIDTQIIERYFSCLTYHYLKAKKPTRSSYQPVPVFNNNMWEVPAFSRVVATSGTFWQMMQQQRPQRLSTFSSHALSFQALVEMDFWQTNIVSEDSRIFWQALLFYDGKYKTIPLNYPVSMDANAATSFWQTVINIYKQQRRWGWGVENVPYILFGFWKNKKIPFKAKWHWAWIQIDGFWSWATNALLIFLLGWLPLYLGGEHFNVTVLSYNLPRVTRVLMTFAMIGMVASAIYSTLLAPRPPQVDRFFKKISRYLFLFMQWALLPITILIFGCFPGLESQTRLMLGKYMGFWVTDKYRK